MRILIVDDESSLLLTLAANLELEGFDVVEASSGERALEHVEQQTFDLVLSDIRMPGISGVDLFRRIRVLRPDLPVILMTGFALESVVHGAIEEGVFAVLPKPFEITHVVATLVRAGRCPLVLVVDDAHEVAESTVAALHGSGVRAKAAFEGTGAVEAVRAGDIDVCVVDMVMTGMDGAEAIRQIRDIDRSIACIAVSGQDAQDLLRKVASLGSVLCMRKPVETGELVRAIATARGSRPAAVRSR